MKYKVKIKEYLSKYRCQTFIVFFYFIIAIITFDRKHFSLLDDKLLISPILKNIHIKHLFTNFMGHVPDFQPIRNLSYLIDAFILSTTGYNLFVTTNILVWVLSCLMLSKLLKQFPHFSTSSHYWILALFSVHPAIFNAIMWNSTRKHFLAFLFATISIYFANAFLKKAKKLDLLYSILSYATAIFSNPVAIFLPFAITPYLLKNKRIRTLFLTALPLTIMCFAINSYNFATSPFFKASQDFNFINSLKILSVGWYGLQSIAPFYLGLEYPPTTNIVFVGLSIFALILFLLLKKCFKTRAYPLVILVLSPIIILLTGPNVTFYDHYLLFPLFPTLLIFSNQIRRTPRSILGGIILTFIFLNLNSAFRWNKPFQVESNSLFKFQQMKGQELFFITASRIIEHDKHNKITSEKLNLIERLLFYHKSEGNNMLHWRYPSLLIEFLNLQRKNGRTEKEILSSFDRLYVKTPGLHFTYLNQLFKSLKCSMAKKNALKFTYDDNILYHFNLFAIKQIFPYCFQVSSSIDLRFPSDSQLAHTPFARDVLRKLTTTNDLIFETLNFK